MSGFIQDTINQATSSTLGGVITATTIINNSNNGLIDSKIILSDLMTIVKECQTRYGGKTELATENDMRFVVGFLCFILRFFFYRIVCFCSTNIHLLSYIVLFI